MAAHVGQLCFWFSTVADVYTHPPRFACHVAVGANLAAVAAQHDRMVVRKL
jgi:hypothetical protein